MKEYINNISKSLRKSQGKEDKNWQGSWRSTSKKSTDELIFRAAMEKQTENRPMDMGGGKEGEGEMYGDSNRNLQCLMSDR